MARARIDARQAIQDIRSGTTDAELMDKYNLSPLGLHDLLAKLVREGIMQESELAERLSKTSQVVVFQGEQELAGPKHSVRRLPGPEARKITVDPREVLADIRSGMKDLDLMKKYDLSAVGVQRLLAKLTEARMIDETVLGKLGHVSEKTVTLHRYECPACHMPQFYKFDTCPQCGVIVSKFESKRGLATRSPDEPSEKTSRAPEPAQKETPQRPPAEKVTVQATTGQAGAPAPVPAHQAAAEKPHMENIAAKGTSAQAAPQASTPPRKSPSLTWIGWSMEADIKKVGIVYSTVTFVEFASQVVRRNLGWSFAVFLAIVAATLSIYLFKHPMEAIWDQHSYSSIDHERYGGGSEEPLVQVGPDRQTALPRGFSETQANSGSKRQEESAGFRPSTPGGALKVARGKDLQAGHGQVADEATRRAAQPTTAPRTEKKTQAARTTGAVQPQTPSGTSEGRPLESRTKAGAEGISPLDKTKTPAVPPVRFGHGKTPGAAVDKVADEMVRMAPQGPGMPSPEGKATPGREADLTERSARATPSGETPREATKMAARDKQSSRPVSEESVVASVTRRAGTAENQHALAGTQQDHVRTLLVLRTLGKNELEEIQGLLGQGLPSEIADDSAGKAVILSPARGRGTVIKALLSSGVVLDARGKSIESPPDGTPGQTPEELLDRFRKAGVRADLLLIAEPSSSEERGQMRQGAPRSSPGELPTASGMAKIQLLQAIRAGNLQMVEEILDTYELVPLSQ